VSYSLFWSQTHKIAWKMNAENDEAIKKDIST
jgi:hypothetical protein